MTNEAPIKEVLPVRILDLSSRSNGEALGEYIGQMAQVGMESLQARFPTRKPEVIERIYNPLDVDLLERQMQKILNLGKSGVCLAAFDTSAEARNGQSPKLVGFTIFKGNKPISVADKVLAMFQNEKPDELEFHVSPQANNKGVGAKLLLNLANEALGRRLLRRPQVTIYGDSPGVNSFLEHYGCTELTDLRRLVPYFGEGTTPVRAYTLEIPEWKTLLLNVFHYSIQKHKTAELTAIEPQEAKVVDLASYEADKVNP